jgi:hypothetical protein
MGLVQEEGAWMGAGPSLRVEPGVVGFGDVRCDLEP